MWCRFTGSVDPRTLSWLLQSEWAESLSYEPGALISVVGASTKAEIAKIPAHDELEISRGLSRAARASNAWILMGGTHTGAARLVGRMMTDAPGVPCLGVAPWSHVDQRAELASSADSGVYTYTTGQHVDYQQGGGDEPGEDGAAAIRRPLEPRVTHFLLADRYREAGSDTRSAESNAHELRRAVENVLSPPASAARGGAVAATSSNPALGGGEAEAAAAAAAAAGRGSAASCPMVLVVMGGGVDVLETVAAALGDGRPVVLLPTCGFAASDIHEMLHGGLRGDDA